MLLWIQGRNVPIARDVVPWGTVDLEIRFELPWLYSAQGGSDSHSGATQGSGYLGHT